MFLDFHIAFLLVSGIFSLKSILNTLHEEQVPHHVELAVLHCEVQRRFVVPRQLVRVCAPPEQHLRDPQVPQLARQVQRRHVVPPQHVHRLADGVAQQQLQQVLAVLLHGDVHRRRPVLQRRLGVASRREEHFGGAEVAVEDCDVQGGGALRALREQGVSLAPCVEEDLHDVVVAVLGGAEEGRGAVGELRLGVAAGAEELGDDERLVVLRGDVEGGGAGGAGDLGVSAGGEEEDDDGEVALPGGDVEGGAAVLVLEVEDGGAERREALEQRGDVLHVVSEALQAGGEQELADSRARFDGYRFR